MAKEIKITFNNESGAALIVALIMMIVLTLIGLASVFTSTFEIKLSGNKRGSTDAFYAADSGVQVTMTNVHHFDTPAGNTTNVWSPTLTENPTNAEVVIHHDTTRFGPPRGSGFGVVGGGGEPLDFKYYLIESTGRDQIEVSLNKSKCTVEEKVVRIVPQ